jgi:flagellar biosynthesis/type III secretory pathway ATPase
MLKQKSLFIYLIGERGGTVVEVVEDIKTHYTLVAYAVVFLKMNIRV